MAGEDRREVLAAVARLPRRSREVLALRYYLDLTDTEIAAALGVSPGHRVIHRVTGAGRARPRPGGKDMSSIEDRLRDAYQEAAATVPPASLRGAPALEPAPGPARPARFFIAPGNKDDLIAYSAVTGRATADVGPFSPHTTASFAAATGNDQVFIVASTSNTACGSTQLMSLTLSPAGKAESISSLPVPRIAGPVTALASSANGRTIAYASAPCPHGAQSPGQIGVVHTDGRPARHWGWNPDPGQSVGSLSITADGRMIEYAATPNMIPDRSLQAARVIRLLPTDARPGTAAQRSRVAVTIRTAAPGAQFASGLIAPGCQKVYFCTEAGESSGRPAETLRAYDVATGTMSVLHSFGRTGRQGCLLGSSAGELLIVRDVTRTPSLVDRLNLSTGRLTPVPVRVAVDENSSSVPW